MRKHATLFILLIMAGAFFYPQQEAKAMDPVTIAVLAPIAIQVAKTMLPYVLKGLRNFARHATKMFKEVIEIMRLPLGVIQVCLLFPFGNNFTSGIKNLGKGAVAPFMMAWYAILIPFAIFGVS